jgi:quercetin dioxygenase-like cupin family protein
MCLRVLCMTITVRTGTKAFAALSIVPIISLALAPLSFAQDAHTTAGPRSRVVASHQLPRVDGAQLHVTLVEVTYAPGESSQPHSHPCPCRRLCARRSPVRMRVGGAPEGIYKAGAQFYEEPHAQHLVSANASQDAPARFLAVLICDHDEALSTPIRPSSR